MKEKNILVIGAGLAGIEASLLCARAGRKVYLVEKESYFGGSAIKSEEVFPQMECATCMLAPKQSEVLEDKNIELLTLSEVKEIKGEPGNFQVKILKKARYVSVVILKKDYPSERRSILPVPEHCPMFRRLIWKTAFGQKGKIVRPVKKPVCLMPSSMMIRTKNSQYRSGRSLSPPDSGYPIRKNSLIWVIKNLRMYFQPLNLKDSGHQMDLLQERS